MKTKLASILIFLVSVLLLSSCSVKINLKLQQDGTVNITFNGGAGAAFSKMVVSASGGEENFNAKDITDELLKSGFTNVKTEVKGVSDIKITMTDGNKKSYIFTSGFVSAEDKKLKINISRKNLKAFYDSANEQVQMILDLFLAPVFNDEEMTQEEYLETIGTFYGASAAEEIRESKIEFVVENPSGEKSFFTYKMADLLCVL